MYFTQEDFRKIEKWLHQRAVKDTQLSLSDPLKGEEVVSIVQDGKNKKMPVYYLSKYLKDTVFSAIYNVTDMRGGCKMTLREAIYAVPVPQRKAGTIITFMNSTNNWSIVQFKGESPNQWNVLCLWEDVFKGYIKEHIYHPDDEDIVGVQEGTKKVLRFKDRIYDKGFFSGKGRKILRMKLVPIQECSIDNEDHYENIIEQKDFDSENTVYVVRYDFTIKDHIKIPNGCEISFEGGTLNGGSIHLNGCKLLNMVGPESDYINGTTVIGWAVGQIEYRDGAIQYWNGSEWVS